MDFGVRKYHFGVGISQWFIPCLGKLFLRSVYLPPKRRLLTYSSTLSL